MTKTPIALSSAGALVFAVIAAPFFAAITACGNVVGPTVPVDATDPSTDANDGMTPVGGDSGEDGPAFEGEEEDPVVDIDVGEGDEGDTGDADAEEAAEEAGEGEGEGEGESDTSDIGGDAQALAGGATCASNAHTGEYCGGDKVDNANSNTLYHCNGPGPASVVSSCSNGCHVAASGSDDFCNAPPAPTCDANAHVGDYCGGDKVSNGSTNKLYSCDGPGPATLIRTCANGCKVAPSGEDDYCKAPPPPTCDSNASSGDYCGGDKVSNANPNKLYRCNGPGPATVIETCDESCVVAPSGQDDFCEAGADDCAHHSQLKWGLAPVQSDHLRCAGITAAGISQTIGNAAASAGTHAQDGTNGGFAYCAATDLRTAGLTDTQVRALLNRLTDEGFAAFFRNPGHDGWPSSEIRHIHAIYVGVPMKSSLRAQVQDWLNGKNGLASHTAYTFYQASSAEKNRIRDLFNAHN